MASGWHTYIGSSPGMYGISLNKETYTYELIDKSGVFGVNFLPGRCSELIQALGTHTGRNINKFEAFHIQYAAGLKAEVPILNDAYFAYECKVHSVSTLGDQEWIVGEVLQRYQDKELFLKNGMPNLEKLDIPLHIGGSSYRILNSQAEEHQHPFSSNSD